MLNRSSKLSLILLLLLFAAALGVVADQAARAAVSAAQAAHGIANPSQVYLFTIVLMMTFLLLTTLPVLMVIAYRGLQGEMLDAQVRASLRLCALADDELQRRLDEYQERNSFAAFVLPSMVNLFLLYLIWDITLLPNGLLPLVQSLGDSAHPTSLAALLAGLGDALSPLTWTLLGGYFYALSAMIRRWMLADLTTNLLWKIDVRLVLTLILGLLLCALDTATAAAGISHWIAALGFLIGIVPDLFLRWLAQQIKRVGGIDALEGGLFAPSELQQKIDGMSFWQVDRLGEEGIESVQDLAQKELPSLLIKTRFDPALLLIWVDRALLCARLGGDMARFGRIHIGTSTDLLAATARPGGIDTLVRALADAGPTDARLDADVLLNIVGSLSNGPNLRHLATYRRNVGLDAAPGTAAGTATRTAIGVTIARPDQAEPNPQPDRAGARDHPRPAGVQPAAGDRRGGVPSAPAPMPSPTRTAS